MTAELVTEDVFASFGQIWFGGDQTGEGQPSTARWLSICIGGLVVHRCANKGQQWRDLLIRQIVHEVVELVTSGH